jgi:hypothetical protein
MMGGERLDISVRNARSTAAPHKRDLEGIVVGAKTIVKRYFDRNPNESVGVGAEPGIQHIVV